MSYSWSAVSRQMISSACLALPPRTTCWRSSGCHLAVPENSPLGDDDAVLVRLPAAAAPPPLHHDHDHHIIITLARSLASPTLPSLLLRPMIVELAFSHAALPLSLTLRSPMRRHCYRSHCCSVFSRDPSVRPVWWSSGLSGVEATLLSFGGQGQTDASPRPSGRRRRRHCPPYSHSLIRARWPLEAQTASRRPQSKDREGPTHRQGAHHSLSPSPKTDAFSLPRVSSSPPQPSSVSTSSPPSHDGLRVGPTLLWKHGKHGPSLSLSPCLHRLSSVRR